VEHRVAVMLLRLSTDIEYYSISNLFSIFKKVYTIVGVFIASFIKVQGRTDLRDIVKDFRDRWGLLMCAGGYRR
jgi:hypothetical protein